MPRKVKAVTFAVVLLAAVGCRARPGKMAEEVTGANKQANEQVASPAVSGTVERLEEGLREQTRRSPDKPAGLAAIEKATEAGRYLFIFFRRHHDEQTRKMRRAFESAVGKVADRANSVVIDVSDPSEKGIVEKFGADRAPMPLALVLAPNGAVTGGFPTRFDEKQLVEAIVSPCMEKCLKALQERKLVLLCVQNATTKSNGDAMRGVRDFAGDSRFSDATEIITLDPTDAEEAEFLRKLQIDSESDEAITAFLAPPGAVVGKFKGATDKDALVAALMSACGSGCGPPGGATGGG